MRIAQVAPLYESVPPQDYGGTERVVAYITDELVRLGHEVTLFASGDSRTLAELVPSSRRSLRLDRRCVDPLAHHVLMMERVAQSAASFDVIHNHIDYLHFPLSRRLGVPTITTLHGRLDISDLQPLYNEFRDMPVVSISDSQRRPLPQARWQATVHHGLPHDLFALNEAPGDYLLFLGRISPEKRLDRAVEIAGRVGRPLKVAAKVDDDDQGYFRQSIAHLLDLPFVEFLGEVGGSAKSDLIAGAQALLFPIDWEEPFGLVIIEAMACGTPTIAWGRGSVPEIVTDGVTGFIVNSIDEAVAATRRAPGLDRREVRRAFEARFTADRMARDYVAIYEVLVRHSARATVGQA